MDASSRGHTECVELLLSHHADPNIISNVGRCYFMSTLAYKGSYICTTDQVYCNYFFQYGWTALFCACCGGHVRIVKVLLTHGVDPNTQDEVYFMHVVYNHTGSPVHELWSEV